MDKQVDQNLYSRVIATYGAETMSKLVALKVLVVGLQGVGIETAKNLVLAGPAAVHILDDQKVQIKDLGVNFFTTESNVQQSDTRAQASLPQLKELNPLVDVQIKSGKLTPDLLSQYSVVVVTDFYDKQKLIEANNFCRSKNIGFIYSGNLGLYGFAFVDFGQEHIVFDTNGEAVQNSIIVNISKGATDSTVTVHEGKRHGFEDGDTVVFREVEGMQQINGLQAKIKNAQTHSFEIELDTTNFGDYTGQGIVEQVKVKQPYSFNSLEQSLQTPYAPGRSELDMLDWEKFGVPEQLHVILNAVLEFTQQSNGQLPELNNEEDANTLVQIAEKLNSQNKGMEIEGTIQIEQFNEDLIKNVSYYARTNISPLASFWGGIVAQEAIKFTGKYTPLRQWLHYEVFEALSEEQNLDKQPCGSRYDDIISIWGKSFMEKLSQQKAFMVGAGALGCEYLKMFALLGLGSGKNGKFTVTDDDQIEVSNLTRQFLFRRDNVGHSKSECAAKAVKSKMNPDFNVYAQKLRVAPENEEYFNDDFWNELDIVVNAVDNVKARLFVDGRCVYYHKPLFESGTLGTKCNSQVVIPKYTQSYGDSVDPPEEQIPLCTLKIFPNQIEHCIQYARDKFQEYLVEGPNEFIKYIKNPQKYIKQTNLEYSSKPAVLRSKLEAVKQLSHAYQGGKYENLVEIARKLWAENFHNQIASLLNSYPLDAKTTEGAPFWSGPKRAPQILDFDANDEIHLNFIQSFANILANIFGIQQEKDQNVVKKMVSSIQIPKFVPKKITFKEDEKDQTEEKAEDDEEIIELLVNELSKLQISQKSQFNPTEFEKDDPTNWHIDFVSSLANLRARNYKIKEVSPFQVKIIAGKIIPAIATTTAMVVGAVGIEVIKSILGKPVNKMRNSFMNLALPLWLFSEPLPPIETQDKEFDDILQGPVKAVPPKFTIWDQINVKGPMTLKQFIDYIKENYKVDSCIISSRNVCIYNQYDQDPQDNMDKDIIAIFEQLQGDKISKFKKILQIKIDGEIDGIDALMPTIKYQFKD